MARISRLGFALPALAALLMTACMQTSMQVASGMVSHNLCSEVFVTGLSPEQAYDDSLAPHFGPGLERVAVHYEVDAERRQVRSTVGGAFESRAFYRPGLGCLLLRGEAPPAVALPPGPAAPPLLPDIAGPAVVEPADEGLRAALARAFEETEDPPERRTRAVVIVHEGRVIAERYAPGFGVETTLLGYSATKGVINALVGILVRERRLALDRPAPVPAWSDPEDPRHAITPDQLLRMTSGLELSESGSSSPAARMLYLERDMAAFASSARLGSEPGTRWDYTAGSTLILSGVIRDAVGGRGEDVLAFARRELFDPLGMRSAVLELDATGTPLGSTYLLASARDWVRFGLLYLGDGVVGGRRILPAGWVSRSVAPTLDTAYGAGFWTNRAPGEKGPNARWTIPGAPPDAFFAGGLLGQYIVVVPSQHLVVARFGASTRSGGDIEGVGRLIADVIRVLDMPR